MFYCSKYAHNCILYREQRNHRPAAKIREWTTISFHHPQTKYFYRSYARFCNERKRHIESKYWYIIHPYSPFAYFWMIIMMFVFVMVVPCDFYDDLFWYGENIMSNESFYFIYILNVLNSIHILLSFFIGYPEYTSKIDQNSFGFHTTSTFKIQLNPKKIAKNYLLSYFVTDAVALINLIPNIKAPMFYRTKLVKQPDMIIDIILIIVQVFRFGRIHTVLVSLKVVLFNNTNQDVIYQIARCVIWVIMAIFFIACYAVLLPMLVERISYSYLVGREDILTQITSAYFKNGRENPSMNLILVHAIMDVVQAIITPSVSLQKRTPEECIFFSIVLWFGMLGKVLIFLTIITVLAQSYSPNLKYQIFNEGLGSFLWKQNLKPELHSEANDYFKSFMKNMYFNERAIFHSFPRTMRYEIFIENTRNLIKRCKMFQNISEEQVSHLALNLHYEIYHKGEAIIRKGLIATCMYFISTGTVAIYNENDKELCHFYDGQYFGEIDLLRKFPDNRRTITVIALEGCIVFRLDKVHFEEFMGNEEFAQKLKRLAELRPSKRYVTPLRVSI